MKTVTAYTVVKSRIIDGLLQKKYKLVTKQNKE